MRDKISFKLIFLIAFIFVILIPKNVNAKSYDIKSYDTSVRVDKEGNANIVETIDLNTRVYLNYYDYEIEDVSILIGDTKAKEVSEIGNTIPSISSYQMGSSQESSFIYLVLSDDDIKKDEKITITYLVEDFVRVYNDVSEITYNMVSESMWFTIEDVKVDIFFEEKIDSTNTIIYLANTDKNATYTINEEKNCIEFRGTNYTSDNYSIIEILQDPQMYTTNRVDENKKDELTKQYDNLVVNLNEQYKKKKAKEAIATLIVVLISIYIIFSSIKIIVKYAKRIKLEEKLKEKNAKDLEESLNLNLEDVLALNQKDIEKILNNLKLDPYVLDVFLNRKLFLSNKKEFLNLYKTIFLQLIINGDIKISEDKIEIINGHSKDKTLDAFLKYMRTLKKRADNTNREFTIKFFANNIKLTPQMFVEMRNLIQTEGICYLLKNNYSKQDILKDYSKNINVNNYSSSILIIILLMAFLFSGMNISLILVGLDLILIYLVKFLRTYLSKKINIFTNNSKEIIFGISVLNIIIKNIENDDVKNMIEKLNDKEQINLVSLILEISSLSGNLLGTIEKLKEKFPIIYSKIEQSESSLEKAYIKVYDTETFNKYVGALKKIYSLIYDSKNTSIKF